MRPLTLVRLLLGLCLALTVGWSAARAADNKDDNTERVKFNTVDGVEIHGVFYPSTLGKKAPCVMCLPKIGTAISQEGWDQLAKDLQKANYAVLLFDYRGCGDSTNVTPDFWGIGIQDRALLPLISTNRELVRGFNPTNPKASISFKDFSKAYYPVLVNDIAAAKNYLDQRNNNGDCNSSDLKLIGAEDGATLGALWLFSQLNLYRAERVNLVGVPLKYETTPQGKDVTACVWLTISPTLGSHRPNVTSWMEYAGRTQKVPMAFVYGANDAAGAAFSKRCYEAARAGKSKMTGEEPIKKSKLAGSALLDDKLDARSWIVDSYLNFVKKNQVAPTWEEKDMEKSVYAWVMQGMRPVIKPMGEKQLPPVPYMAFLNR